jgi:ribonucleotide monophosphatase NagD (HAD superfamily)
MLQQLCIHHGATSIAEGNTMVSNALKAKDEPVVVSNITRRAERRTSDLRKITFHLNYDHLSHPRPIGASEIESVLQSPWPM